MKNLFVLFIFFGILWNTHAQNGIAINNDGSLPDNSAILDVKSTEKGFLPPRLSTSARDAINNPSEGLMIFNTDVKCMQWFDGIGWFDGCNGLTYVPNVCNPSNPTLIVDVTNPTTGKTWMDRNLGASRAATSSNDAQSYGSLFQWGRGADGHQCVNRYSGDGVTLSSTTTTPSTGDSPGNALFIFNTANLDWRASANNNLWQGVNGINNPCPSGYRIPTEVELNAERLSWSSNNSAGAFASPLKLPVAGYRAPDNAGVFNVGVGIYWSSTVDDIYSRSLDFDGFGSETLSDFRGAGLSVRCIKN